MEVDSDEVRFARSRLESLLGRSKLQQLQAAQNEAYMRSAEDSPNPMLNYGEIQRLKQRQNSDNGSGKQQQPKILTFEIRQKTFEVPDTIYQNNLSLYAMSRAWVRGKHEDPLLEPPEPSNLPSIDNEPVEALIDRDIYRMPRPTKMKHPSAKFPEPLPQTRDQPRTVNDRNALLAHHLPRWRTIRQRWQAHAKLRDKPYKKSVELLDAMFNASQENQEGF